VNYQVEIPTQCGDFAIIILMITMTETVYSIGQLKKMLAPVFNRNGVKKAVLFGSYGKGIATPKSDIDLFVDSGLKGFAYFGLLDEVIQTVDKNVDLIDVIDVEHGSFIEKEIDSTGVLIYEK
jgi:predicted nucleotidyltransferase